MRKDKHEIKITFIPETGRKNEEELTTSRPVWSFLNGKPSPILSCIDAITLGKSSTGILEYLKNKAKSYTLQKMTAG